MSDIILYFGIGIILTVLAHLDMYFNKESYSIHETVGWTLYFILLWPVGIYQLIKNLCNYTNSKIFYRKRK